MTKKTAVGAAPSTADGVIDAKAYTAAAAVTGT
jgi:hypothetical protein